MPGTGDSLVTPQEYAPDVPHHTLLLSSLLLRIGTPTPGKPFCSSGFCNTRCFVYFFPFPMGMLYKKLYVMFHPFVPW